MWELYAPDDWTQARNVVAEHPDRLRHLQRLFMIEAGKYNVFPLDDRKFERFNADLAGRPQLIKGNTQKIFGGMGRLSENSVINLKNKSHSVTADVEVSAAGAGGVIVAQGGRFGGWVLYVHDGRPAYCYNLLGLQLFKVYGDTELTPGDHQVRMEFAYDGGGLAKGGNVSLYVDGALVGRGRVDATQPMIFSGDETTDVGNDTATPVSDDYTSDGERIPRAGPMGADRHRRRSPRRRPPDHRRGAVPRGSSPPVATNAHERRVRAAVSFRPSADPCADRGRSERVPTSVAVHAVTQWHYLIGDEGALMFVGDADVAHLIVGAEG